MPFYEYRCGECGHVFTLLQKRDAPREGYECPECGKPETARILSTFAAHGDKDPMPVAAGGGGGHCCGGSCACGH